MTKKGQKCERREHNIVVLCTGGECKIIMNGGKKFA